MSLRASLDYYQSAVPRWRLETKLETGRKTVCVWQMSDTRRTSALRCYWSPSSKPYNSNIAEIRIRSWARTLRRPRDSSDADDDDAADGRQTCVMPRDSNLSVRTTKTLRLLHFSVSCRRASGYTPETMSDLSVSIQGRHFKDCFRTHLKSIYDCGLAACRTLSWLFHTWRLLASAIIKTACAWNHILLRLVIAFMDWRPVRFFVKFSHSFVFFCWWFQCFPVW